MIKQTLSLSQIVTEINFLHLTASDVATWLEKHPNFFVHTHLKNLIHWILPFFWFRSFVTLNWLITCRTLHPFSLCLQLVSRLFQLLPLFDEMCLVLNVTLCWWGQKRKSLNYLQLNVYTPSWPKPEYPLLLLSNREQWRALSSLSLTSYTPMNIWYILNWNWTLKLNWVWKLERFIKSFF